MNNHNDQLDRSLEIHDHDHRSFKILYKRSIINDNDHHFLFSDRSLNDHDLFYDDQNL